MMKLKVLVVALAAGSSLLFAPMAGAAPNQHAVDNANDNAQTRGLSEAAAAAPNDNAQTRGLSVAAAAGGGAAPVLDKVAAFAPDAAKTGLARAQCVAAGICEP